MIVGMVPANYHHLRRYHRRAKMAKTNDINIRAAYASGALVLERMTSAGFVILQILNEDVNCIEKALQLLNMSQFKKDIAPLKGGRLHGVAIAIATPNGDPLRVRWNARLMGSLLPVIRK